MATPIGMMTSHLKSSHNPIELKDQNMTKLIVAIVCIGFAACKSSTSSSPSSGDTYLMQNANWDSGGTHGYNGWSFTHTFNSVGFDTADFEQDAPPGGGTWGFKIHSIDLTTQANYITRKYTNLSSGVYEFSLWSHYKYVFPDSIFHPAWISITKESGGVATTVIDSITNGLYWAQTTMYDTLTSLLPTDAITLEVSSGIAIVHGNPNTVDDFTFAKLP